jgi:predicted ATP-grasp superfamily ATP-dependent carboligase
MSAPPNPVVVFVLSPTGLAVARSLAPRGVPVWGVDSVSHEIGHHSRWVRRDARFSHLPAGPELLQAVLRFAAEQPAKPVLFVAGDPYIDFLAENHEVLRRHCILQESMRPEVSSVFLNKRTFYERCSALGIAMPQTFFPADEPQAREAAAQVRYPAIVKPTYGHLFRKKLQGEKLVEVGDAAELVAWWTRFRDWGGDSVIQEVVVGPEANIFVAGLYTDAKLVCRSLFTARKSRQYPPMYGSGSYMEACWNEEIARLSMDVVTRLDYRGICGTEYKWDERDRAFKLIEINPRPTLWYGLTRKAGVDVIFDAYCDLVGRPNPVHIGVQDDRARWQLPARDLVSAWHFLRRGELSVREFLRTFVDPRGKDFGDLSLRDPRTLLAYPLNIVQKFRQHRGA